jgi:anthranilate synthase component I
MMRQPNGIGKGAGDVKKKIICEPINIGKNDDEFTIFNNLRKQYKKAFFMNFPSFENGMKDRFILMVFEPSKEYIADEKKIVKVVEHGVPTKNFNINPLNLIEEDSAEIELINREEFDIPFKGGVIGYLAYDYCPIYLNEKVGMPAKDPIGVPIAVLMSVDKYLLYNTKKKTLMLYEIVDMKKDGRFIKSEALKMESLLKRDGDKNELIDLSRYDSEDPAVEYKTNMTKREYLAMIKKAKSYLDGGEAAQVVLSQRFKVKYEEDGFDLFYVLNKINPSPHMYYLDFNSFSIIGSSPETHSRCEKGKIKLNILGGTQKRGDNKEDDRIIEDNLQSSNVSQSEHVMLIESDIADFSRIAEEKSLKVHKKLSNVKYGYTQYLSSVITAKLKKQYNIYDLLKMTFPRGVVVGSPKERAMQIISELEPERRSFYAGVVLCCDYNRADMEAAITIITSLLKDGLLYVQCGGGIIKDSNPEEEYKATLYKAMAHMKAASWVKRRRQE